MTTTLGVAADPWLVAAPRPEAVAAPGLFASSATVPLESVVGSSGPPNSAPGQARPRLQNQFTAQLNLEAVCLIVWRISATGSWRPAWLLAALCTPLFFNIYSSRVFEADKAALARSLALLALAAWLGKWLGAGEVKFSGRAGELYAPAAGRAGHGAGGGVSGLHAVLRSAAHQPGGRYPGGCRAATALAYLALFAAAAANLRRRAQPSAC